jgi:glycerophosphoryl diester phosphodiesterase
VPYLPLAREAGRIHVCGHRGHSAGAPENTLPALRAAAELGATVAEVDVALTRDDEIVLLHDEILDRTTNGKGRVAELTLAEVKSLDAGVWFGPEFAGTAVPTLHEALATARDAGLGLLVESKERQRPDLMTERLVRLLQSENAFDDLLVISFDHVWLLALKERCPAIRTELITHARHVDIARIATRARAASLSIEWDMFHTDDSHALHAAGIAVRVSLPRPERLALRRTYGFADEAGIAAHLAAGEIDVLAGDDVALPAALVGAASRRV